jgi:DNA-binding Lrp family transcriptional regulator
LAINYITKEGVFEHVDFNKVCDIIPAQRREVICLSRNTKAYILIEALPGKAMELVNLIKDIKGINTVHLVTGPYDVIAFAEASDLKSLGEIIVKRIQATGCVARTLTCILVEE